MSIFKFNPNAHVIIVDAVVDGPSRSHKFRMILDTGASVTMLNPEILNFVGYDSECMTKGRPITTASGIEYVPFAIVSKLEALGQTVNNLQVCAHSLPGSIPVEGLLGINFLKNFNVHFKFLESKIEIEPS